MFNILQSVHFVNGEKMGGDNRPKKQKYDVENIRRIVNSWGKYGFPKNSVQRKKKGKKKKFFNEICFFFFLLV